MSGFDQGSFGETARRLADHFSGHLAGHLELLREMVEINSFTANPAGVDALGVLTAKRFAALGFTAQRVPSENALYGQHLILTREGQAEHGRAVPKIGLVSHLDTVFPAAEEQRNDFRWRVAGERIYGPGTVDIKGGTVLIFMMLAALQDVLPELYESVTWVVLLDATEEVGGRDFGRLCVEHLAGDTRACLVFEGGNYDGEQPRLVAARKGMIIYRIEVEGKAAHAGSSHPQGANAIAQMAEVVRRVCALTDYEQDLTFNVGTIAGGTVINRVPHFASASVEMRAFRPEVYEAGLKAMLALDGLSTVSSYEGGFPCRVSVQVLNHVLPWPRNPQTERLLGVWQATARDLGYQANPEERAGLSDGNYFWAELPTLDGLGPAGGNAHCSERSADGSKDQEYVLRASFVPKALLNTMAILRLLAQGEP
jgi:glutamate carboxypeptidase